MQEVQIDCSAGGKEAYKYPSFECRILLGTNELHGNCLCLTQPRYPAFKVSLCDLNTKAIYC
jgi:hypothetical protein